MGGAAQRQAPAVSGRFAGRKRSCLLLRGGPLDGGPAVRAAGLDLDPARLALLGLRDLHLEHTLVEGGLDGVGVHALRERQRAAEATERALHAIPPALTRLVLRLALAADRKRVVADLDVHVALAQTGQIRLEQEVIVGLDEVHRRHPALRLALFEERVEEAMDLVREWLWLHQKRHS